MRTLELRARLALILRVAAALALIVVAIAVWMSTRSSLERSSGDKFNFKGNPIEVFHCAPASAGPHPAVILLHGAGYRGQGHDEFEAMCRSLANRGYYAEFIEYFDASSNSDPTVEPIENLAAWVGSIELGIKLLARNPAVDPKRIGVMGFSQGAYLAVGCGALYPHDVAAVVEYYGGLLPIIRPRIASMPPTLIIHGEADTIIPVAEAHELDACLTKAARPHEMHLYPGVGHGFNFHGDSDSYNRDASDDAWRRALEFLDRVLISPSGSPSTLGKGARG